MNKLIGIIFIFGFVSNCIGQNRRFIARMDTAIVPFYMDDVIANGSEIDVIHFDRSYLSSLILSSINSTREKKSRMKLNQDSLLNLIADSGIETFSRTRYIKRASWKKEQKSINHALILKKSRHKVFSAFAFMIDLLDLQKKANFYYERRDKSEGPRLYKGKRPNRAETDEDYFEPEAVKTLTEIQFEEEILKMLNKKGGCTDLYSKKFTCVGVSIKIDQRTIHKARRPAAFVIIIFGGKKLQKVKPLPAFYSDMDEENYQDK